MTFDQRPWTVNQERTWHHMQRANIVKEWREAFFWLTKEAQIPELKAIKVVARPYLIGRGRNQDVAACVLSVKAALDGIVDAGVLPDDSPQYVHSIEFLAPIRGVKDALELRIVSLEEAEEPALF